MSARVKRWMGAIGAVAMAAVAGCAGEAPVVNVGGDDAHQRGIAVTGRGEVSGAPDTVSVSIGVSVKRDSAPAAITDAAASAQRLIDALKAAGVVDKDIQTTNYSINQEFRYPESGPVPDGFRVSNSVVAKVRDTAAVGGVIDAATTAGGADAVVQGIAFSLDDDTAALESARAAAFADAKAKAEQFAELSGRKLGRVEAVSQTVTTEPVPTIAVAAFAADEAAKSTPIQAGEVDTVVTVDVRWSFEDD